MRELKKKTVDGHVYEFSQLNTTQALRYSSRIFKMLLEPLALGVGALGTQGEGQGFGERSLDDSKLALAARTLVEHMDEDGVLDIIRTLTSDGVLCDGKKIVFDLHYEDQLGHLLNVLAAAVEVQFGSFFGAGGAAAAVSAIRNRITTPVSPTSTGPSGDQSKPDSSAA